MSEKAKRPAYTAVVLHPAETQKLLQHFQDLIPDNWQKIAHHMTINLGAACIGPAQHLVGKDVELNVTTVAFDDRVVACGVEAKTDDGFNVPSNNKVKHITLAVNRALGGKPVQSNDLTDWMPADPLKLIGRVEEVC